jgi:hypothetical protein
MSLGAILDLRQIAKARIERQAGEFRCSGRITAHPEVDQNGRNVRVGDDTGVPSFLDPAAFFVI